jgi:hypothetical protein
MNKEQGINQIWVIFQADLLPGVMLNTNYHLLYRCGNINEMQFKKYNSDICCSK